MELMKVNRQQLDIVVDWLKRNNLPYEDVYDEENCFFLVSLENKLAGLCGLEACGDYALMRSVVVKDSFRGQGLGKELCELLITYAQEQGFKELYLLTSDLKSFFEQLGFRAISRELVPEEVQRTPQFAGLCCVSDLCMKKGLGK